MHPILFLKYGCDRLHRMALGVSVASRWCLLLLEVATWSLVTPLKHTIRLCGAPKEDL